ncbi:MocR-like pyridoxine biosynthesis transcription factor PdxR [Alginatibacterium sediminis]|uniref:MocR-like pyridoxine biosynthesis transcription factor PdxR n=1 Tax=Alginatibacterium sediminis TaxID=2164068 RepID=UPI0018F5BEFC|nr:PLP-dependent aminotransferase family protein [Alginatibacterium sediminis]
MDNIEHTNLTLLAGLTFNIDRQSKISLSNQISNLIRTFVNNGQLKQAVQLPSTRILSIELSVSRSTVVNAYEQLVAEGYIHARTGAGYRVCSTQGLELPASEPSVAINQPAPPAAHLLRASHPDMRLFAYKKWAKHVARVCRTQTQTMLVETSPFGNAALRQSIAEYVKQWRGIEASAEQIIITAGAGEAVNICFASLSRPGERIGLEDPGYPPILRYADSHKLKAEFLDVQAEGTALPSPKYRSKLVVLTPSHQYPLGGVMSPQRRRDFIAWAKTNNSWIIEDDYDSEFRYAGQPIPALASFDKLQRCLYVGSFSKIFSNTLRLGYIIAPLSLVNRIESTMMRYGFKAGLMPQQALSHFMDSGDYYRHLRRVRKTYNERRKYLVSELQSSFNNYGSVQEHPAGMQLIFSLNSPLNDSQIASLLRRQGVDIRALSGFSQRKLTHNGLVMGFCGNTLDEIAQALEILRQVLRQQALT